MMRTWIKKGLALVLAVVMVVGILPLNVLATEANSAPGIASVPAVQSITAKDDSFTLTSEARFFIVADSDPTGTDLATYVQTANAEFAARGIPSDSVLPIVYGEQSLAKSGDIIVKVDRDAVTASQGYTLDITADNITITGNAAIGVLYGLHTVLQSMVANGTTLMAGTATDYPDVAERSLYVDAGRVFYSVDLMKSIIRTLSWNKMNVLYLDFSNNNATRFFLDDMHVTVNGTDYDVSTCKPSDGYWSEADMNELLAEADRYGVQIIPTFDSPGHIGGVSSVNDSWFYRASATDYDAEVGKITLDLSNEDAYAFGQALVAKYVDYFASKGCTSFNIAADEASYADGNHMNSSDPGFVSYVNALNDYIVSKGMTTRMFNDAVKSVDSGISKDIIILYWVPASPNAQALLAAGYDVVNFSYPYVYYAYGASDYWNASLSKVYGWNPGMFGDSANAELGDDGYAYTDSVGKVLGGNFAIWSDYGYNYGKTGADVIKGTSCAWQHSDYSVRQKIYAVAERTWNQDGATADLSSWEATLLDAPAGLSVSTGEMDATALPRAAVVTPASPTEQNVVEDETTGVCVDFGAANVSSMTVTVATVDSIGTEYVAYDVVPGAGYDGTSASVTLPISAAMTGKTLTGFYVTDDGVVHEVEGVLDEEAGTYTFSVPHFSVVGVMVANEISFDEEITVQLGVPKTDTLDGHYTLTDAGDTNIATTNVNNIDVPSSEGSLERQMTLEVGKTYAVGNGTYWITVGNRGQLGTTTTYSRATQFAVEAYGNGYALKSGNYYLAIGWFFGSYITADTKSYSWTYSDGRLSGLTNSGWRYVTVSSSGVDLGTSSANGAGCYAYSDPTPERHETQVTFSGVSQGVTYVSLTKDSGETHTYKVTVVPYAGTENLTVETNSSTELTTTGLPEGASLQNYTSMSGNVTIQGTTIVAGSEEGSDTITADVYLGDRKIGTYTWHVTIESFHIEDSIEIPISIVDYRSDGLLFEFDLNGAGIGYQLIHTRIGDSMSEAYDRISGTEIVSKELGDNAADENRSTEWGNGSGAHVRQGLVQETLGDNGMPVYTDAAVEYVAELLSAGYGRTNIASHSNDVLYDTFLAYGSERSVLGTATTGMSASFAATHSYDNIRNAYDLAYYLLNTLYQADTNMVRETADNGVTYSIPIYGMNVDAYDRMILTKNDQGNYYMSAYRGDVTFDRDNRAIYNNSTNETREFFYPIDGLGYDAYFGNTTDGTITASGSNAVNGNYTLRGEAQFVYHESDNLFFSFTGDDDVYLFINGHLVLDLGGAHWSLNDTVYLNDVAEKCGLKEGEVATFTFFYMERYSDCSNFGIETNLKLVERAIDVQKNGYLVSGERVASGSTLQNGETIDYEFVVENNSSDVMENITISDQDNNGAVVTLGYGVNAELTDGDTSVNLTAGEVFLYQTDEFGDEVTGSRVSYNTLDELSEAIAEMKLPAGYALHVWAVTGHFNIGQNKTLTYTNTATAAGVVAGTQLSDAATHNANIYDFGDKTLGYVVDFGLSIKTEHLFPNPDIVNSARVVEAANADAVLVEEHDDPNDKSRVTNYTLTYTMHGVLDSVNTISLAVQYDVNGEIYNVNKNIYVIPATTVYYEASHDFNKFGAEWDFSGTGNWNNTEGTAETQDVVKYYPKGENGLIEASADEYNYGYDPEYLEKTYDVATSSTVGDTVQFTFTGDGVDIYADTWTQETEEGSTTYADKVTNGATVMIWVKDENGASEKILIVDTNIADGKTTATHYGTEYKSAPLASISGLNHGKHTVGIRIVKAGVFNFAGFRVYNTTDANSQDMPNTYNAYLSAEEDNPSYIELRNSAIASVALKEENINSDQIFDESGLDEALSNVLVMAKSVENGEGTYEGIGEEELKELLNNGPKNELFVTSDYSVTFTLNSECTAQIGLHSATGETVTYQINDGDVQTLNSTVDMFYDLPTSGNGTYTIEVTSGVLSITDLKVTGSNSAQAALAPITRESVAHAMVYMGYGADKSALEDLVSQAEGMDLTGYTVESVAALQTALTNAQSVLADNTLLQEDQQLVDDAVAALTAAVDGLTVETEPQPSQDPEVSQEPEATKEPETTQQPQATKKPESVPQTGDHAPLALSTLMLVGSAVCVMALAVASVKRRRS